MYRQEPNPHDMKPAKHETAESTESTARCAAPDSTACPRHKQDRDSWHAHAVGWSRDANGKWVFADDLARDELGLDPEELEVAPVDEDPYTEESDSQSDEGQPTPPPGIFSCAAREQGKPALSMAEFEEAYDDPEEVTFDRRQKNNLARHQRRYDTSSMSTNPFDEPAEEKEEELMDPEMEAWLGGVVTLRNADGALLLTEKEKARRKMLKEWEEADRLKAQREATARQLEAEEAARRKAAADEAERKLELQREYEAKQKADHIARLQAMEEAREREIQRKEEERLKAIEDARLAQLAKDPPPLSHPSTMPPPPP